ncbi:MAG: hypothetical protein V1735_08030 [Nanoarchaeota archaeon]
MVINEDQLGSVALASIEEAVQDPFYQLQVRVETGPTVGTSVLVAYHGDPQPAGKRVAIRFGWPITSRSRLALDGPVGYFLTSTPPPGFEYGRDDGLLLYGIWEHRLQHDAPSLIDIINRFNPGPLPEALYLKAVSAGISTYSAKWKSGQQPSIIHHNPAKAIREYLRTISTPFAHLLVIDEIIHPRERQTIFSKFAGRTPFELEPQQRLLVAHQAIAGDPHGP